MYYGLGTNGLHHRATLSAKQYAAIEAQINAVREFVLVLQRAVEVEPRYRTPVYDVEEFTDVATIAAYARAAWRLPSTPITHLVPVLEEAGIVLHRTTLHRKVAAIGQWLPPAPPIILINHAATHEQVRKAVAHELGHFVMHDRPTPQCELETDIFAEAFLGGGIAVFERPTLLQEMLRTHMTTLGYTSTELAGFAGCSVGDFEREYLQSALRVVV